MVFLRPLIYPSLYLSVKWITLRKNPPTKPQMKTFRLLVTQYSTYTAIAVFAVMLIDQVAPALHPWSNPTIAMVVWPSVLMAGLAAAGMAALSDKIGLHYPA
jgi:hypothetical protein